MNRPDKFVVDWFVMDTTYKEVRLVNAMTVLENLIASNLDDDVIRIALTPVRTLNNANDSK